jgi:DNA-binding beta-propeller fold protein YncE
LAFDQTGDLYVLCGAIDTGTTVEYAVGTSNKLRTLLGEGFHSIAVDDEGYVYLAGGEVIVFPPQGRQIWHRIVRDAHNAAALLFDDKGDLYIAHQKGVGIFAPGGPGKPKLSREIEVGVRGPRAIALSRSGELFVANCLSCIYNDRRDSISVYAKNGSVPMRTIFKSLKTPIALAVDSKGRLYVANVHSTQQGYHPGWVSVYPPGATLPLRKITEGVNEPLAIAIDPNDNVYVANSYGNSVTVYSPGGTKLLRTIRQGVNYPEALAFSNY